MEDIIPDVTLAVAAVTITTVDRDKKKCNITIITTTTIHTVRGRNNKQK